VLLFSKGIERVAEDQRLIVVADPKPEPKPEKENPFLPTKKKNDGGPFLPTQK
jgi:hypothetical protein